MQRAGRGRAETGRLVGHEPLMTTGGNVAADLRLARRGGVSRVVAPPPVSSCLTQRKRNTMGE